MGCDDGERVSRATADAGEIATLGCRPDDRIDAALMAQTRRAADVHARRQDLSGARARKTTRNTNTAWWDASQLYGYSDRSGQRVKRDPARSGQAAMEPVGSRAGDGEKQGYLPPSSAPAIRSSRSGPGQEAVAFPDNWSIGLSFFHNVFAREHNLFVDEFRKRATAHPDDDSGLRDPAHPRQS